jgi:hypothetical protein
VVDRANILTMVQDSRMQSLLLANTCGPSTDCVRNSYDNPDYVACMVASCGPAGRRKKG